MAAGSERKRRSRRRKALLRPTLWILFLLVLTQAASAQTWIRTYGGVESEGAREVLTASGGGFVVIGQTSSSGAGSTDAWILRLGPGGEVLWEKALGGPEWEGPEAIVETPEGGFLVVGASHSFDPGGQDNYRDTWIVRLSAEGEVLWQKALGYTHYSRGTDVLSASDGGFLVLAEDLGWRIILLKIDADGNHQWSKWYEGSEYPGEILSVSTGGYLLLGGTNEPSTLKNDLMVLRIDETGGVLWQRRVGAPEVSEYPKGIVESGDGGFLVLGKKELGYERGDTLLVKIDSGGLLQWTKTYSWKSDNHPYEVIAVPGDGYRVAGWSDTWWPLSTQGWILAVDERGDPLWRKTYGGTGEDGLSALAHAGGGGLIAAGFTRSYDLGGGDLWVLRLDAAGVAEYPCSLIGEDPPTGIDTPTVVLLEGDVIASDLSPVVVDSTAIVTETNASVTDPCVCERDEYDPDEVCGLDAGIIRSGETQARNFCDAGDDWLRFYSCPGPTWTIETSDLGAEADTVLDLYGPGCDNLLATDDNGAGGLASRIQWTATEGGMYFVRVRQADGTGGWEREYSIRLSSVGPHNCGSWMLSLDAGLDERAAAVEITDDGGTLLAGSTSSVGAGGLDGLLAKVEGSGEPLWQRTFGGIGDDEILAMRRTSDGGFVAAGTTTSWGAGGKDAWVLKLDAGANILWGRALGGSDDQIVESIVERAAGGFLLAGRTGPEGEWGDGWVAALDEVGSIQWQRRFEAAGDDRFRFVGEAPGGDVLLAGLTNDGDRKKSWFVRTDAEGELLWGKTLERTSGDDEAVAIYEGPAGRHLAFGRLGSTWSPQVYRLDLRDTWGMLRAYERASSQPDYWRMEPASVTRMSDGGHAIAGTTHDWDWRHGAVLKLDPAGEFEWMRTYGGLDDDSLSSVSPTPEGGLVVAGSTRSFGAEGEDLYALRADASGTTITNCGWEWVMEVRSEEDNVAISTLGTVSWDATFAVVPAAPETAEVAMTPDHPCWCARNSYDRQNTCDSRTQTLEPGEDRFDRICGVPENWYRFDTCHGETYTVETWGLAEGVDTVLEIWNGTCGTLLASDDDSGAGPASLLTWTAPSNGTTFVRVAQKDGRTGRPMTYHLSLEGMACSPVTWVKTYAPSGDSSYARAAIGNGDGGVFIAGGHPELWAANLDDHGNILWQQWSSGEGGEAILANADGGITVGGRRYAAESRPTVKRFSPSGLVTWERELRHGSWVKSLAECSDGGILIGSEGSWREDGYIYRLDAQGDLVWTAEYDLGCRNVEAIQETSDGGAIAAGGERCATGGGPWIMKIDSSGRPEWARSYGHDDNESIADLRATPDGGFILAGWTQSWSPSSNDDAWVVKVDASGAIEWQKAFRAGPDLEKARSILPLPDGGSIFVGEIGPGRDEDAWAVRLDATGGVVWQRKYAGQFDDNFEAVAPAPGGGFYLVGHTRSFGPTSTAWVVRTDEWGLVSEWCDFVSETQATSYDTGATGRYVTPTVTAVDPWMSDHVHSQGDPGFLAEGLCEGYPGGGSGFPPGEVSPRGAVVPLLFLDRDTLVWEDGTPSDSAAFNLYRGMLEALPGGDYGACFAGDLADNWTTDPSDPPQSGAWFYLVTGENANGEGPAGYRSDLVPRVIRAPCP